MAFAHYHFHFRLYYSCFAMRSLLLISLFYLNSVHSLVAHDRFAIEQPPCKNCLIAKRILFNFIEEYVPSGTIFLSFIVSKEAETPFQKELFATMYSDPMLSKYSYRTMSALIRSTPQRRKSFNMIIVKDSETLKYVLFFSNPIESLEKLYVCFLSFFVQLGTFSRVHIHTSFMCRCAF